MKDNIHLFVPRWYVDAKASGASAHELKEKIRLFCIEALLGKLPETENLSCNHALVLMTFEMYEKALSCYA